jgi:hypothetical protein
VWRCGMCRFFKAEDRFDGNRLASAHTLMMGSGGIGNPPLVLSARNAMPHYLLATRSAAASCTGWSSSSTLAPSGMPRTTHPRGRTKTGPWELPRNCCLPHAPRTHPPPHEYASLAVIELRPPATHHRTGKPRARRSRRSTRSPWRRGRIGLVG